MRNIMRQYYPSRASYYNFKIGSAATERKEKSTPFPQNHHGPHDVPDHIQGAAVLPPLHMCAPHDVTWEGCWKGQARIEKE